MKILQFFYNRKSKTMGFPGAYGFRASQGIWQSEKNEIVEKLKNIIFHNEDSDKVYYSFFKLESGRYCMWAVRILSIETGEFSCHGFIPGDGYFPFYPAELLGSPSYNFDIIEELEDEDLPLLDDIAPSWKISYDELSQFIKPRMKHGFNGMIDAIFEYKKNGFGIYICDNEDKLPLWISIVQMSFPLKLAHEITFTNITYTENKMDFVISCYANYIPLQIKDDGRHYIFDYIRGLTRKPHLNLKFKRIVEVGYSVSKRSLDMFHKFISQFDYSELDQDIDGCYNLFMLTYLHQTKLNNHDIKSAFDFALKYGPQDVLDDIYQMTETFFETLVRSVDTYAAKPLAEYMFKTSLNSRKLILQSRVCYFFFSMLDHMIIDKIASDAEELFQFYNDIKSYCGKRAHSVVKYSTEHQRINYLSTLLTDNCACETGEFYLRLTLDSFIELGYLWSQMINIKDMADLLDKCISSVMESSLSVNKVLDTASKNEEFFAKVIMLFYNRTTSPSLIEELIKKLCSTLDNMDEECVLRARRQISSMGGGKLLLGELSLRLSQCQNKIEIFENYCRQAFDKIPSYDKEFYSEAVSIYIKSLDSDNLYQESLKILKELVSSNVLLNDDSTALIVSVFEKGLPLTAAAGDIREIIPQVKKIKKTKNIKTYPDITDMADFALWLENMGSLEYNLDELLDELRGIRDLDAVRHKQYMEWCLPQLLRMVNTAEDHKTIVHHMAKDNMDIGFYDNYSKLINAIVDKNSSKGTKIFMQFCVYFFFYLEPKLKMLQEEEALDKICIIILDILMNRSKRFLEDVDNDIKMEFEGRGLSLPVKWTVIYNEVRDKKKTSIKKFINNIYK